MINRIRQLLSCLLFNLYMLCVVLIVLKIFFINIQLDLSIILACLAGLLLVSFSFEIPKIFHVINSQKILFIELIGFALLSLLFSFGYSLLREMPVSNYRSVSNQAQSFVYKTPITGMIYSAELLSETNNLGIVELPVRTISSDDDVKSESNGVGTVQDIVLFRLIDINTNQIIHRNTYTIKLAEGTPFIFPFGFPVQAQSKGKNYRIELEYLSENTHIETQIGFNDEERLRVVPIYSFQFSEILSQPLSAIEFFRVKLIPARPLLIALFFLLPIMLIVRVKTKSDSKAMSVFLVVSLIFFIASLVLSDFNHPILSFYFGMLVGGCTLYHLYHHSTEVIAAHKLSIDRNQYLFTIGLAVVLFLASSVFQDRLMRPIGGDELHIFNTAVGLLKTGRLEQWNWLTDIGYREYSRSSPLTYVTAALIYLFGIGEVVGRLPYLVAGVIGLISLAFVVKKITASNSVSSLVVLFFATNLFYIFQSTIIRGYIFLLVLGVWCVYLLFSIVDHERKVLSLTRLVLLIVLSFLAFLIDIQFMMLLPFIFTYILYYFYTFHLVKLSIQRRFIIGLASIVVLSAIIFTSNFIRSNFFTFIHFPTLLTGFAELSFLNISYLPGLLAVIPIFILLLKNRDKRFARSLSFLATLFIFFQAMLLFVIEPRLGFQARYVGLVIVINFIFLIYCFSIYSTYLVFSLKRIRRRYISLIAYILTATVIILINIHLAFSPILSYYFNSNFESEYNYIDMYTSGWTISGRQKPDHSLTNEILSSVIDEQTVILDFGLIAEGYYYQHLPIHSNNYYFHCVPPNTSYINLKSVCTDQEITVEDLKKFLDDHRNEKILIIYLKRKDYAVPSSIREYFYSNPFFEDISRDLNTGYQIFLINNRLAE